MQCLGNYTDITIFNYLLQVDIFRNSKAPKVTLLANPGLNTRITYCFIKVHKKAMVNLTVMLLVANLANTK